MLLYLDKFEDELATAGSLPEPTTPEYEQEIDRDGQQQPPEGDILQEYIELNI